MALLNVEEHTLNIVVVDISNYLEFLAVLVIPHTMLESDRVRSALFLSRSDKTFERRKEHCEVHHLY